MFETGGNVRAMRCCMDRLTVLAVVAFLVGCEPATPMDSYCSELERAKCEAAQRCGTLSESIDCTRLEVNVDCVAPYRQALDEKWLHFDAIRARQCVDDVRDAACVSGFALGALQMELCRDVFVGDAREGEACGVCAAELNCVSEAGSTCGVCRRREPSSFTAPVIGDVCTSPLADGLGCQSDAWCMAAPSELRCVARPLPGEPCGSSTVCVDRAQCVDEVCVLRPALKGSCTELACQLGLVCVSGVCELQRNIGSACTDASECNSGICLDGVCAPFRTEGEACASGLPCQLGLRCENATCIRVTSSAPQCRP